MNLHIRADGTTECIYDDALQPLLAAADSVTIRRASHVEPDPARPTCWLADMTPSGGPILGAFTTRKAALEAEVAWLEAHALPKSKERQTAGPDL